MLSIFLVFVFGTFISNTLAYRCPAEVSDDLDAIQGATPFGNTSAGVYTSLAKMPLSHCVDRCCTSDTCHVALHYSGQCLLLQCVSDEMCKPVIRSGSKFDSYFMVYVRHADNHQPASSQLMTVKPVDELSGIAAVPSKYNDAKYQGFLVKDPLPSKVCELSVPGECSVGEICIPKNTRARQGVCVCQIPDYHRDSVTRLCIGGAKEQSFGGGKSAAAAEKNPLKEALKSNDSSPDISVSSVHHLIVSAGDNKIIRLPENGGSLSAFAIQKDSDINQYKYEWTLVSHPPGDENGSLSDKNAPTLKFSGLKEGLYTFKVTVSSENATGEAFVNVTVLPRKRVNQPPVSIINPVNQTVKLPNADVVLDGSASYDDDKIVSYIWEVDTAPIDYKPQLTDAATLQLKNLIPGFFRFILTVTDSDGVKNSSYANVSVIKETDYPPTANAGPDVIIYLPQKELTLNGNHSTDDKGIKSWEWTKSYDTDKAVDMQNTRTPFLHLSNLESGMYKFVLRVTDTTEQSSTSEVHVFVKPGNNGPYAFAGMDQEITLPLDSAILDGSKSHDDVGINQWEWKQVSGPTVSHIEDANTMKAKASRLTKGVYVFQLTVYDNNKAFASNTTTVTVKQSKNNPPKANAGGDITVELPRNLVILNGSSSSDDVAVVSYLWSRDLSSLAVGEIIEGTERKPQLMLTALSPGRYLFRLTVTDAEGVSDSDTASLVVKSAVNEKNDIEMTIASDIYSFTEEHKVTMAKKLALLLQEEYETTVIISKIAIEKNTNRVILVFHVEKKLPNGHIMIEPAPTVVHVLKKRLRVDGGILNIPVIFVDSVVCQNNCSGHGSCDQYTKWCVCEAFWMENVIRSYLSDGESNCEWSILYVIIVIFFTLIILGSLLWSIIYSCNRKLDRHMASSRCKLPRPRKRFQRYAPVDNGYDKELNKLLLKGYSQNNSVMISDSDLESETTFDKLSELKGSVLFNGISTGATSNEINTLQQQI